jgi:hypothetical protein
LRQVRTRWPWCRHRSPPSGVGPGVELGLDQRVDGVALLAGQQLGDLQVRLGEGGLLQAQDLGIQVPYSLTVTEVRVGLDTATESGETVSDSGVVVVAMSAYQVKYTVSPGLVTLTGRRSTRTGSSGSRAGRK